MIGKILQSKMDTLMSAGGGNKFEEEFERHTEMNVTMVFINETYAGVERLEPPSLGEIELFQGYPPPLLHFATICCVLFILLGIPGNLGTIVALYRCKKVSFFSIQQ